MGGAATLEPRTAPRTGAGRVRARDHGAVELVRFLADPLRYLDGFREDPRGVVAFRLGRHAAELVKEPERLEGLDWPEPRPELGPAPAAVARRAESWTEGEPIGLAGELAAIYGSGPRRRLDGVRAVLGGAHDAAATSVAAVAWTLHLLERHPDAEARWHAELDEVLDGRMPTGDDVPALPWTACVFEESTRLFPPVWAAFRRLPDGRLAVASPWVTHRDPRVWPDPLRFTPERWDAAAAAPPPGLGAFPFSAPEQQRGEAVLVLATLGQRWAFRPAGARAPRPAAAWATEPRGLRMRPVRRG
jgi:hypothetical protein